MRVAIAQGGGPPAVINASLHGAVAELTGESGLCEAVLKPGSCVGTRDYPP